MTKKCFNCGTTENLIDYDPNHKFPISILCKKHYDEMRQKLVDMGLIEFVDKP